MISMINSFYKNIEKIDPAIRWEIRMRFSFFGGYIDIRGYFGEKLVFQHARVLPCDFGLLLEEVKHLYETRFETN